MAYFSGNAFSIINTLKFTEDFVDYMQFCGAGIEISDNLFEKNIGLKRHNGGAAVISCKVFTDENNFFVDHKFTSGHFLERRYNLTEEEEDDE